VTASKRSGRQRALLFIDLDNFKSLNDTLGHAVGDLLLKEVGERLTGCIRAVDTAARVGGDEFVVILEDLGKTSEEAAARAGSVAEKILSSITQPYVLAGRECRSTASMGITVFGMARKAPPRFCNRRISRCIRQRRRGGRRSDSSRPNCRRP